MCHVLHSTNASTTTGADLSPIEEDSPSSSTLKIHHVTEVSIVQCVRIACSGTDISKGESLRKTLTVFGVSVKAFMKIVALH